MSWLYFALRILFILYCFFVLQTDTSGNNCDAGFVCGALCISLSWKCDGDADCVDGSDEQYCGTNCNPKTEFRCDDKCLPIEWQCDKEYDCADRSDEQDCGCPDGTFGNNCSSTCGKCREGTACRNDNGVCPNGCQDGYQGIYCINECDDGKYGTNCSEDCGECRNNQTCDKVDGHCPEGCEDGYMYESMTCNKECTNGTYGTNCSMNCGNCGNNETCNKSNGFCPSGCEDGYTPPTCSEGLIKEENGSKCDSPTLYVIVSAIAVLALTVAITLIFIIAKRWNRPNAVLKLSEIEMLQP